MLTQHFHQINIQRFAYKSEVCAKLKHCGIIVFSTGSNFLFAFKKATITRLNLLTILIFSLDPADCSAKQ